MNGNVITKCTFQTSFAQRFGFTYEGLFKQSNICKGRNRDTAWFSLLIVSGQM